MKLLVIICRNSNEFLPKSNTYYSNIWVSWFFVTPWTEARQAPLAIGCSRQENWSGLSFSPSGDLPDPGVKPVSPASLPHCRWILYCWATREAPFIHPTLESPLDNKEIQPVHPKGDQSWISTGRTDAKAETPILWPPDVKNWVTGKDLMLGKIEGGRRRGRQRMRWLDGITDSMDMCLNRF